MSKSSVTTHSLLILPFQSGYFLFSSILNRYFILVTVPALQAWIAGEPWPFYDPGFQRFRAKNMKTVSHKNINYNVNCIFHPSGENLWMPGAGKKLHRGEAKHFPEPWKGSLAQLCLQFSWTNSPWQLLGTFCVSADLILDAKGMFCLWKLNKKSHIFCVLCLRMMGRCCSL